AMSGSPGTGHVASRRCRHGRITRHWSRGEQTVSPCQDRPALVTWRADGVAMAESPGTGHVASRPYHDGRITRHESHREQTVS
ncbi:MAG: hypothetical protein K0U36_03600, partial [Alphaproteobacteria bacterium]|nr:hypothetical protein [Alphaproteobacteria bacterium]